MSSRSRTRSEKAAEHAADVLEKLSEECEIANQARMSAYLAALNYQKANEAYSMAQAACSYPNNEDAQKQAILSMDSYFSSRKMVQEMDKYVVGTCGQGSLGQYLP